MSDDIYSCCNCLLNFIQNRKMDLEIVLKIYYVIFLQAFRILSSLSQRSLLYQCQTPTLKNGQVRIRQRGRLARFTCAYSYTVYGDRFAECKSGRWDNPVPHCISMRSLLVFILTDFMCVCGVYLCRIGLYQVDGTK